MNGKELLDEKRSVAEEQGEVEEAAEPDDLCPIDAKPWSTSACKVLEERLLEKLLRRLQAEQAPEEVAVPAAEIAGEDSLPTADPESGNELVKTTEEETKEV